MSVKMSI